MSVIWYRECTAEALVAHQVEQLNEQLKTLAAEQAELAKYQAVDKERRSLEYTIHDRDISQTRDKLEKVPAASATHQPASGPLLAHCHCRNGHRRP